MVLISGPGCSGSPPGRDSDEGRSSAPSRTPGASTDSGALRVTISGIGPLRAGVSVTEASSLLGAALAVQDDSDPTACGYLLWPGGPAGVSVMVDSQRIARVEVRSGTTATLEGARIGDSDQRIRRLYAGRVTASPHKYTAGQYLTVAPASPADSAFRLIFETEEGRVTRYRSGRLPQVEWVEGCS